MSYLAERVPINHDAAVSWFFSLLTDNPAIRMVQLSLLGVAAVAIYLVFYTTRDILLRTRSFFYQLVCILLVALLPILGFFLYLLIRPASTVRERELEKMLKKLTIRIYNFPFPRSP